MSTLSPEHSLTYTPVKSYIEVDAPHTPEPSEEDCEFTENSQLNLQSSVSISSLHSSPLRLSSLDINSSHIPQEEFGKTIPSLLHTLQQWCSGGFPHELPPPPENQLLVDRCRGPKLHRVTWLPHTANAGKGQFVEKCEFHNLEEFYQIKTLCEIQDEITTDEGLRGFVNAQGWSKIYQIFLQAPTIYSACVKCIIDLCSTECQKNGMPILSPQSQRHVGIRMLIPLISRIKDTQEQTECWLYVAELLLYDPNRVLWNELIGLNAILDCCESIQSNRAIVNITEKLCKTPNELEILLAFIFYDHLNALPQYADEKHRKKLTDLKFQLMQMLRDVLCVDKDLVHVFKELNGEYVAISFLSSDDEEIRIIGIQLLVILMSNVENFTTTFMIEKQGFGLMESLLAEHVATGELFSALFEMSLGHGDAPNDAFYNQALRSPRSSSGIEHRAVVNPLALRTAIRLVRENISSCLDAQQCEHEEEDTDTISQPQYKVLNYLDSLMRYPENVVVFIKDDVWLHWFRELYNTLTKYKQQSTDDGTTKKLTELTHLVASILTKLLTVCLQTQEDCVINKIKPMIHHSKFQAWVLEILTDQLQQHPEVSHTNTLQFLVNVKECYGNLPEFLLALPTSLALNVIRSITTIAMEGDSHLRRNLKESGITEIRNQLGMFLFTQPSWNEDVIAAIHIIGYQPEFMKEDLLFTAMIWHMLFNKSLSLAIDIARSFRLLLDLDPTLHQLLLKFLQDEHLTTLIMDESTSLNDVVTMCREQVESGIKQHIDERYWHFRRKYDFTFKEQRMLSGKHVRAAAESEQVTISENKLKLEERSMEANVHIQQLRKKYSALRSQQRHKHRTHPML